MDDAQGRPPAPVPPRRITAAAGRVTRSTGRVVARRVDDLFSARGPAFRRLAVSHVGNTAGDTLVAIALAGTLFLTPPSSEARGNVALYLLLTLAPFAVLGPSLGALLVRHPTAYRHGLGISSGLRAVVAFLLIFQIDHLLVYPLAFTMLVLSRIHGISRNSLIPVALEQPLELVSANARMATIGVLGGTLVAPFGAVLERLIGPGAPLTLAMLFFLVSARAARFVPSPEKPSAAPPAQRRLYRIPRGVRIASLATAVVRFLNGFLLLVLAFAFKEQDSGLFDFAAVLGAASFGYFIGALISSWLERRIREEPMVVAALAVEAAAAFIAAQTFGLLAAAVLAAAAGLAWGVGKLGFDGLLQRSVDDEHRGRVFVRIETSYQIVWVIGALVPVLLIIPTGFGLAAAGVVALTAQVIYVASLISPGGMAPPEPLS